ncbi:hypothetical protein ACFX11_035152 [Malus domestica]
MQTPEISIEGASVAKVCSAAFGASLDRVVAFVRKLCICQGLRLYRRQFGFSRIVRHDDDCLHLKVKFKSDVRWRMLLVGLGENGHFVRKVAHVNYRSMTLTVNVCSSVDLVESACSSAR